jgi:hypothetical protein
MYFRFGGRRGLPGEFVALNKSLPEIKKIPLIGGIFCYNGFPLMMIFFRQRSRQFYLLLT